MAQERYLVTGAAGFIGSALVRELNGRCDVYSVIRPNTNTWRLPSESRNHHLVQVDITNYDLLKKEIKKINPTHIFHLATYGVYRDQLNEHQIFQSNVTGTLNLLKCSLNLNLGAFINTGSVYEYADLPGKRVESIVGQPRNSYDEAKVEATTTASKFADEHGLPICTLRLFTTYGPYEDPRRLIPKVILSFLRGESPIISPTPIRDFIYLKDVVTAYFLASTKAPKKGEVINIGSGSPTTVKNLVEKIQTIISPLSQPLISDQFAPTNDSQCWADIDLARSLLDWRPSFTLSDGLTETIVWFKKHQELYSKLLDPD